MIFFLFSTLAPAAHCELCAQPILYFEIWSFSLSLSAVWAVHVCVLGCPALFYSPLAYISVALARRISFVFRSFCCCCCFVLICRPPGGFQFLVLCCAAEARCIQFARSIPCVMRLDRANSHYPAYYIILLYFARVCEAPHFISRCHFQTFIQCAIPYTLLTHKPTNTYAHQIIE